MRRLLNLFRPRDVVGWVALAMASAWTLFALANVSAGQTPLGLLRSTGHDESLPVVRVVSTTADGQPEQVLVHFPAEGADANGDLILDHAAGSVHDGVVDVRIADTNIMAKVDYEGATDARSVLIGLLPALLVLGVIAGRHVREARRPVSPSTWSSYATKGARPPSQSPPEGTPSKPELPAQG